MTIAGHDFFPPDAPDGCCTCGLMWSAIAHVTRDHIGQPGLAHYGNLNTHEAEQIIAERERRVTLMDRIWGAVVGVSAL